MPNDKRTLTLCKPEQCIKIHRAGIPKYGHLSKQDASCFIFENHGKCPQFPDKLSTWAEVYRKEIYDFISA